MLRELRKTSLFWFTWFFLCSYPFYVNGLSVNYLNIFTPLIFLIIYDFLDFKISTWFKVYLVLLLLIFTISFLNLDYWNFLSRKIISFSIFISFVSLSLIKLEKKIFNSIVFAILLVSLSLSIKSIYMFSINFGIDAATLKGLMGSQRNGFLFLFSFGLIHYFYVKTDTLSEKIFLYLFQFILLAGLLLTFSRSAYIGIFVLFIILLLRNFTMSSAKYLLLYLSLILVFLSLINSYLPNFYLFLDNRLFSLFDSANYDESVSNVDSSEGARVYIWNTIVNYVSASPFYGSGFLGLWVITDEGVNAHSEFFDRLFRTGFFGFLFYIFFLFQVFKFLYFYNRSIFIGAIPILFYGLFHETFSLSHGAFIFSFLVALYNKKIITYNN